MLFSATIPSEVAQLAQRYMNQPVEVSAESQVDPSKLHQVYFNVEDNMKFSLLVHLLKHEQAGLIMVFCNSRNTTDFVATNLQAHGIEAQAIHGGFSQGKRSTTMRQFHSQRVHVLVCTDLAARGLDIPGVSHVYNYDLPKESKQYIHRIGRTARAGQEGKALNLLSHRDHDNFSRILRDYPVTVKKEEMPQVEPLRVRRVERQGFRGGPGPRQSGGSHRFGGYGSQHSRGPPRGGDRQRRDRRY